MRRSGKLSSESSGSLGKYGCSTLPPIDTAHRFRRSISVMSSAGSQKVPADSPSKPLNMARQDATLYPPLDNRGVRCRSWGRTSHPAPSNRHQSSSVMSSSQLQRRISGSRLDRALSFICSTGPCCLARRSPIPRHSHIATVGHVDSSMAARLNEGATRVRRHIFVDAGLEEDATHVGEAVGPVF